MTDSLRPAVEDALAVEILRWGIKAEKLPAGEKHLAGLAVDVVLDVLADRADEWWVEAAEGRAVDCRTEHWVHEPEGLIAVLRGDTE